MTRTVIAIAFMLAPLVSAARQPTPAATWAGQVPTPATSEITPASMPLLPAYLMPAKPEFTWRGRVAPGQAIEVKGVIGDVRAVPSTGRDVEVAATKRADRSDPDEVEIIVVEHDSGVTICAVYPTPPASRRPNACVPGRSGQSVTGNDVTVDFIVEVPDGVHFVGSTVNGGIRAENLQSPVQAHTVSGDVRISTSAYATATTVSGSIDARLGRTDWDSSLSFKTVSGDITVALPADANTQIEGVTATGTIGTDLPLTVRAAGRVGKRVDGTVGNGRRTLRLESMSGDIRLLSTNSEWPTATRAAGPPQR